MLNFTLKILSVFMAVISNGEDIYMTYVFKKKIQHRNYIDKSQHQAYYHLSINISNELFYCQLSLLLRLCTPF